jgi:cytochrome c oxidase subunit 2
MPIVVKVVTDAEYTTWAAEKKVQMAALADDPSKTYTMDELKKRGEKVYAANCAACHQPNGKGAGAFPALDGSKVVNGSKDGQYKILLNGLRAMPKWSQLNDVELASVMTYTRNSWGNKTGELIQPKDFTTARAAK